MTGEIVSRTPNNEWNLVARVSMEIFVKGQAYRPIIPDLRIDDRHFPLPISRQRAPTQGGEGYI